MLKEEKRLLLLQLKQRELQLRRERGELTSGDDLIDDNYLLDTEMDETDNSCKDECKTSPCSVDNSTTVINKIANLYAERLMSDVCLVVGNVSIYCNQSCESNIRSLYLK